MAYERGTTEEARAPWGGAEAPTIAPSLGPLAERARRLRRALHAHRAEALAALMLALMAANLFSSVLRKSITNDEVVHIPAGYYHLVAGDFRLNNEHPPLVKMWAALPLLLLQPEEPPAVDDPSEDFMQRTWGYDGRFWQANRARFEAVSFWPRVMMLPLTLALGWLLFAYARKLFGARAALFALALYTLEPNFLAHGRIVHTDVPAALAYLLFFFALHAYAEAPGAVRALLLGLAAGLALVTKFSMIVLAPVLVAGLVALLWAERRRGEKRERLYLKHACAVAVVALLVVNAAYYFKREPLTRPDVLWIAAKSAPAFKEIMLAFGVLSNVVPTYFLFGLYNVTIHNQYGHGTYLLGQHAQMGWWYYFPAAFALKTTIPFLLLTIIALLWSLHAAIIKREKSHAWILIPLSVYAALSITSNINIGIRHLLPAFPFLFIMGGAFLDRLLLRPRVRHVGFAAVVVLFGWMCFEVARAYPHYVPYMNQLAARGEPWQYLSDSNVEWGDDVGELAEYLKARGETRVRAALLGGPVILPLYGVEYVDMLSPPEVRLPETRYVAIGASFLNGSTVPGWGAGSGRETKEQQRNFFDAYRRRTPEAVFGHSIYLYRVE